MEAPHVLVGISLSVENVLNPRGSKNAKDIITSNYMKEFGDRLGQRPRHERNLSRSPTNTFRENKHNWTSPMATCQRKQWCISQAMR